MIRKQLSNYANATMAAVYTRKAAKNTAKANETLKDASKWKAKADEYGYTTQAKHQPQWTTYWGIYSALSSKWEHQQKKATKQFGKAAKYASKIK